MRARLWIWVAWAVLTPYWALGHVGSPDVFYDGKAGPYPVRVTIRMPTVVPGRAEIVTRAQSEGPVEVSYLPLYSRTAVSNAPPADAGRLVRGETNLYSGELWLMSMGAYSIEVRVKGREGEGRIEIPVNSVALSQMALPVSLGAVLVFLTVVLLVMGWGIVVAAAREGVLPAGVVPEGGDRRRARRAGVVMVVIFAFLLWGGNRWWKAEEAGFRERLRGGAWPDMKVEARVEGSDRVLRLTLGETDFGPNYSIPLLPDHGKLLHFFLIRQPSKDAFAHLHPVRKGGKTFEVTLPPLPEGRYEVLCDLTLENSGLSSTATNVVDLPAVPAAGGAGAALRPDPDDSWAVYPARLTPGAAGEFPTFKFPTGERIIRKSRGPWRTRHDAGFDFAVEDAAGKPAVLEPYMGMISHTAVLRKNGAVFAHLHPSGNYSMAAQMFFEEKMQRERGGAGETAGEMDHARMGHMDHMAHMNHTGNGGSGVSTFSLPYEFPSAGDYRIWVQFKTGGRVLTGVFDAAVQSE